MAGVFVDIGVNIDGLTAGLAKAGAAVDRFGKKAMEVGQNLSLTLSAPIIAFGVDTLRVAGNFESAMNGVGAISNATEDQIKDLTASAREMGATTQFSATEAAKAMEVLAQNGLNASQILGGAADASLSLAAATKAGLGQAGDILTDVAASFKKDASELPDLVNGITGVTTTSKFAIQDYAGALASAGGAVGALGVSFEDFNAAIALTSSSFSSGQDAGTSFKTFIQSLTPNSKEAAETMQRLGLEFFDAQGRMKDLASISGQLEKAFNNLTPEQAATAFETLFGSDGVRTALSLATQGVDGFQQKLEDIGNVKAADIAAKRMEGFNAAIKQVGSAFEALQLSIADSGLLDVATNIANFTADMLRSLSSLDSSVLTAGTIFAGLAAAIGPVLVGLGFMSTTVIPAVIAGFAALTSPIGLIVASVAGVAALIIANWEDVRDYFTSGAGSNVFQSIKESAINVFENIKTVISDVADLGVAIWSVFGDDMLKITGDSFDAIFNVLDGTFSLIKGIVSGLTRALRGDFSGAFDAVRDGFTGFGIAVTKIMLRLADNVLAAFGKIAQGISFIDDVGSDFNNFIQETRSSLQAFGQDLGATELEKLFNQIKRGAEGFTNLNLVALQLASTYSITASEALSLAEGINKGTVSSDQFTKALSRVDGEAKSLTVDLKETAKAVSDISKATSGVSGPSIAPIIDRSNLDIGVGEIINPNTEDEINVISEAMARLNDQLTAATQKNILFGNSNDLVSEKQNILKQTIESLIDKGYSASSPLLAGLIAQYNELGREATSLSGTLVSYLSSALGTLTNSFDELLAGTKTLKTATLEIVNAFIAQGVAAVVAGELKTKGGLIGALAIPLSAAAGAGASALFKSIIPAFATGAVVSGPTLALVGDNHGAGSGNPELIAPANTMMGFIEQAVSNASPIQSNSGKDVTVNIDTNNLVQSVQTHMGRKSQLSSRFQFRS